LFAAFLASLFRSLPLRFLRPPPPRQPVFPQYLLLFPPPPSTPDLPEFDPPGPRPMVRRRSPPRSFQADFPPCVLTLFGIFPKGLSPYRKPLFTKVVLGSSVYERFFFCPGCFSSSLFDLQPTSCGSRVSFPSPALLSFGNLAFDPSFRTLNHVDKNASLP